MPLEEIQNRLRQRRAALAEASTAQEAEWQETGKGVQVASQSRDTESSSAGAEGMGKNGPVMVKVCPCSALFNQRVASQASETCMALHAVSDGHTKSACRGGLTAGSTRRAWGIERWI